MQSAFLTSIEKRILKVSNNVFKISQVVRTNITKMLIIASLVKIMQAHINLIKDCKLSLQIHQPCWEKLT